MSVLKVVEWPAKVLETRAEEVTVFDSEFRKFVQDMFLSMEEHEGIGLAANQVGVLKRVFVIEIPFVGPDADSNEPQWWHNKRFTFVNPVITKKSGKFKYREGCLSFPEIYDYVERPSHVTVTAQDENGVEFTVEASGLFAICIQHELDHLDGIVFINRMSRLKVAAIRKELEKRTALLEPTRG